MWEDRQIPPPQSPDDELQERIERLHLLSERVRERRIMWRSWDLEMRAIQQEQAWRRELGFRRLTVLPPPRE